MAHNVWRKREWITCSLPCSKIAHRGFATTPEEAVEQEKIYQRVQYKWKIATSPAFKEKFRRATFRQQMKRKGLL